MDIAENWEESSTVTVRVERIEAAGPSRVEADESKATDSTRPQEQPAQEAGIAGGEEDTQSPEETGDEPPKEVPQPQPGAKDDPGASNPINALAIPTKNPRVNEYFLGLCDELVDSHRRSSWNLYGIFSKPIREMIKDEETWVTLVLALMQVRVTYLKGQEKPKEATSRDQKKTPR
jgi:hypothetical protein